MTPLWCTDKWDGPLRGITWYGGWLRYFDCYEEGDYNEPRRFYIRRLTLGQILYEMLRHAIFVIWVKKIRYGWRGFYWLFPPERQPRYCNAPIIHQTTMEAL